MPRFVDHLQRTVGTLRETAVGELTGIRALGVFGAVEFVVMAWLHVNVLLPLVMWGIFDNKPLSFTESLVGGVLLAGLGLRVMAQDGTPVKPLEMRLRDYLKSRVVALFGAYIVVVGLGFALLYQLRYLVGLALAWALIRVFVLKAG